jgi:hypothetical protein
MPGEPVAVAHGIEDFVDAVFGTATTHRNISCRSTLTRSAADLTTRSWSGNRVVGPRESS